LKKVIHFEMDADFSRNPTDLEAYTMHVKMGWCSSGFKVCKGAVENWPANRIALSKGASCIRD
jgi:hypothetical protein